MPLVRRIRKDPKKCILIHQSQSSAQLGFRASWYTRLSHFAWDRQGHLCCHLRVEQARHLKMAASISAIPWWWRQWAHLKRRSVPVQVFMVQNSTIHVSSYSSGVLKMSPGNKFANKFCVTKYSLSSWELKCSAKQLTYCFLVLWRGSLNKQIVWSRERNPNVKWLVSSCQISNHWHGYSCF